MDYDIIYVGEGRNAPANDHRTGRREPWRPSASGPAGGGRTVVVPPGSRPTVITSNPSALYPTAFPAMGYAPVGYPPGFSQLGYPQGFAPPMASFASRFGMTSGELIDTGIQLLAAIIPLPGAPTAQGEAITDVENLVTYQGALAQHAKRDEQLRTLGNLLVRILK